MSELSGMTGNERLYHLGLFDDFDAAVAAKDKEALLKIYIKIEVPEEEARKIIDDMFGDS